MALPAQDDFNRADGGVGANWTNLADSFVVVSNCVQSTTDFAFPFSLAAWTADVVPNGQYAQLTLVTATSEGLSPAVRVSAGNNAYWVAVQHSELRLNLNKWVGGASTLIQNINVAPSDGDVLFIAIDGPMLQVFLNGGQIGYSATDDTLPSGAAGMVAYRNTGVGDDFECGVWPLSQPEQDLMSIRQRMV